MFKNVLQWLVFIAAFIGMIDASGIGTHQSVRWLVLLPCDAIILGFGYFNLKGEK